jgi:hypothetical protein
MTFKGIFHHSHGSMGRGMSNTEPRRREMPVISVVDKLNSPFMDSVKGTDEDFIDALDVKRDSVGSRSFGSNSRFQLGDPYTSLKLNDEMDKFYKSVWSSKKLRTNTAEFRKRLELLKLKQQLALDHINDDEDDGSFNFLFRDFVGHLNVMIDAVRSHYWIPPLLVPLIQLGGYDNTNCQQAFSEVSIILRRISSRQEQDATLSFAILTDVWHELTEIMRIQDCPNAELAFEMLKTTIEKTPLSPELIYKVSIMRNIYPDFYSDGQIQFRLMRARLFRCLTTRLTTEYYVDEMDKVRLVQEAMNEIHISYSEEPTTEIRQILSESLANCNLTAYSPSELTLPDLRGNHYSRDLEHYLNYYQQQPQRQVRSRRRNIFRYKRENKHQVLNPEAARITKGDVPPPRHPRIPSPTPFSRFETKIHDQFKNAQKNVQNFSSEVENKHPSLKRASDYIQRSPAKFKYQIRERLFKPQAP